MQKAVFKIQAKRMVKIKSTMHKQHSQLFPSVTESRNFLDESATRLEKNLMSMTPVEMALQSLKMSKAASLKLLRGPTSTTNLHRTELNSNREHLHSGANSTCMQSQSSKNACNKITKSMRTIPTMP